jgi:hypothetical protein
MKIRVFTEEEMLEKGAFWLDNVLMYCLEDCSNGVKNADDYHRLSDDEKREYNYHAWHLFYEDELAYTCGETFEIDGEDEDDYKEWIYVSVSFGTVCIPNLQGIAYEVVK